MPSIENNIQSSSSALNTLSQMRDPGAFTRGEPNQNAVSATSNPVQSTATSADTGTGALLNRTDSNSKLPLSANGANSSILPQGQRLVSGISRNQATGANATAAAVNSASTVVPPAPAQSSLEAAEAADQAKLDKLLKQQASNVANLSQVNKNMLPYNSLISFKG